MKEIDPKKFFTIDSSLKNLYLQIIRKLVFWLILIGCLAVASCKSESDNSDDIINDEIISKDDIPNPTLDSNPIVDYKLWKIENGKFYLNGERVFLKVAKPLLNLTDPTQVDKLISNLDVLRTKFYNTIALNCYWHFFDTDGDGIIDKSLEPLNKLINAIYKKGMFPCLGVETYSVGGGVIPSGFWERFPDAYAIDSEGKRVIDEEYGFGTDVVSIFHPGYRETVHNFIRNLAKGIDTKKILYFETTVEPQYMGTVYLCYSESAKDAYRLWREKNNILDPVSEMPESFPIPNSFIQNKTWNEFRAASLAEWVNGDAMAYREIAGPEAYVAVDYLDADERHQVARNGNPIEFLKHLTTPNIIQVNWHWHFPTNSPNQKAYDRIRQVNNEMCRNWAITEHMTLNGSDFLAYDDTFLELILENTLSQGTGFGWEFTNVLNNSNDVFCLYKNDWTPKNVIQIVDEYWGYWLYRVEKIHD